MKTNYEVLREEEEEVVVLTEEEKAMLKDFASSCVRDKRREEWLQANNNWMKANAMLQNLITLVSEEDETVDVISSLDVINDYMESIRTNLDVIENYI